MAESKQRAIGNTIPRIIVNHVLTPFNAFNFAIGVCLAAVGAYENLLYLLIILCNILIGIVQDVRAKRIVEKLSLLSAPSVRVIRGGTEMRIPPEALARGEEFILSRGDQVCADATVLSGSADVNEALLTGEAAPINKKSGDTLLSGSFVVAGACKARAERVGEESYASSITREAKKVRKNRSVIMESLNKLVRFTSFFILPLGAILFYESYAVNGTGLQMSVTTTSAALLGLLPKGLVLLTSVSLALGVIRLGKCHTLVQELFGIESLARVDVLCMDKTGTLTTGNMEVDGILPLGNTPPDTANRAVALLCSAFAEENNVLAALKRRFPCDEPQKPLAVVPFSSERAWSAAEFASAGTLCMGAPEKLFCHVPDAVRKLQEAGGHIIAVAHSAAHLSQDLPQDLVPLCAISLSDEIRPEAAGVLRYFEEQGVRLMIFSGDSAQTTQTVANRAGLPGSALDAGMLHAAADYDAAVREYRAFGRVLPEQKKALVQALQRQEHTVAMLGDGVNDVLAIRHADCGIAMASGCDAARRVARLVLMDNSFSSMPKIVSEGRRVVNNIRRVAAFFLTKTCFSFFLSLICALTRTQYPFTPIQLSIYSAFLEALPALFLTLRPNAARIRGDIVADAIRRALPYAAAITAGVMLIHYTSTGLSGYAAAASWLSFAWTCCVGVVLILRVVFERKEKRQL